MLEQHLRLWSKRKSGSMKLTIMKTSNTRYILLAIGTYIPSLHTVLFRFGTIAKNLRNNKYAIQPRTPSHHAAYTHHSRPPPCHRLDQTPPRTLRRSRQTTNVLHQRLSILSPKLNISNKHNTKNTFHLPPLQRTDYPTGEKQRLYNCPENV